MKQKFNQGEIDWWFELALYAYNPRTHLFENCSNAENLVVELHYDLYEDEVKEKLDDLLNGISEDMHGCNYILYNAEHRLVGFAYYNS